jgi:hypothetical protein
VEQGTHDTREGQLGDEEVGRFLILSDLPQSDGPRAIASDDLFWSRLVFVIIVPPTTFGCCRMRPKEGWKGKVDASAAINRQAEALVRAARFDVCGLISSVGPCRSLSRLYETEEGGILGENVCQQRPPLPSFSLSLLSSRSI